MQNRPIRYRGTENPVIERFRIGGRTYLAVAKIGTSGRRAFQVFDPSARQMRALHILPNSTGGFDRVRTLQRLTRGDNEILQILECHREDNSVYVILPWIDGFNLRSVLAGIRERNRQRIAAPEAVRLVKGVAHALRHLHRNKQIIHGDIKPANLVLTNRTSLVLIDYGNAWTIERTTKRFEGDGVSGAYSAPEFLGGQRHVDFRADCFSLGVVLYEILTDKIPYDGYGGKIGTLPDPVKSGSRLIPPSEISPEREKIPMRIWRPIDDLIAQSLAVDSDERFATSCEWLDAWNSAMTEIRRTEKPGSRKGLGSQVIDWIQRRLG
ncbi:Serine/threonine-protein kinase PknB [Crateriforma conspicua]|uniref:Serine/threonine-protein kinase PknB n=1 Tax=Crateriforma conspicua TaxID=2527996 RepID=A0A5C6FQ81_9PLAN|nr:protein kinase [Crateriforma conspicua]TWU62646.1 Serine/threonine-protein kinase PknB [Crateriforma conspicua]